MGQRYSHEQKNPPSQPTGGWLTALGYAGYALIGAVLLAVVVVLIAFCVPHGSST